MTQTSRSTFFEATDVVTELVERVNDQSLDWAGHPGLGEWDLRALVGHTSRSFVTLLTYLDQPAERIDHPTAVAYYTAIAAANFDPDEVTARGVAAGQALGPHPAAAFRQLAQQAVDRLGTAAPDEVIQTIAGGMRVDDYLLTRTFELVVHGLDIARATGLPCTFGVAVMAETCALAGAVAAERGNGEILLMAATGRARLPAGFSVVF